MDRALESLDKIAQINGKSLDEKTQQKIRKASEIASFSKTENNSSSIWQDF